MSETLDRIQKLVASRAYQVSDHAFREMQEDDILPLDLISGLSGAVIVKG